MSNRITPHRLGILTLLLIVLLLGGCEDGVLAGVIIIDGRHVFSEGMAVHGDLVVFGGETVIEFGAAVNGSVWVLGGKCSIEGLVEGDVTAFAGRLSIADGAHIGGNVALGGSIADIGPEAQITGQLSESNEDLFGSKPSARTRVLAGLQQALLVALLGLGLAIWQSRALSQVGRAAMKYPTVSLAAGVLAGFTGLILLVLMGFTIILLPLVIVLGLGGLLAVAYGWIGLGAWLAGRLAPGWLPIPVGIALGSLVVVVVVNIVALLPVAGGIAGLTVAAWGLGATLITQFGYRAFRPVAIPGVSREGNKKPGEATG